MAWVQLQTMQEHANLAHIRPAALFTCSTVINNTVSIMQVGEGIGRSYKNMAGTFSSHADSLI